MTLQESMRETFARLVEASRYPAETPVIWVTKDELEVIRQLRGWVAR